MSNMSSDSNHNNRTDQSTTTQKETQRLFTEYDEFITIIHKLNKYDPILTSRIVYTPNKGCIIERVVEFFIYLEKYYVCW